MNPEKDGKSSLAKLVKPSDGCLLCKMRPNKGKYFDNKLLIEFIRIAVQRTVESGVFIQISGQSSTFVNY